MRAKSVRQLLESAAHVEKWQDGIGWIAYPMNHLSRGRFVMPIKTFTRLFRIVTVKGKAIA